MKFLDLLFSDCRWYRKLRGGAWVYLRLRPIPHMAGWFHNPQSNEWEIAEKTEDYE